MTLFRSRRAAITVAAATTVLALIAGIGFERFQREREWAHGGDRLTVDAEVALATAKDFDEVAVRLGAPPGEAVPTIEADQTVVVRVRWSGLPKGGYLHVIALDKRVTPPALLDPDGGWNSEGGTGYGWSSYLPLAEHYDWLRGVAKAEDPGAVDAPGTATGTVTAWFHRHGEGGIPFRDPASEILVAMFSEDEDSEVRSARRVSG
ncbi:hypothetical protein AB0J80_37160 [Actinoplanes sp. NPDC049548]|uniref:hypothetical protein n=1 Tax=Actinoplanes sp. NPDC049548 TaxID=3155152 RepID=UPI003438DE73